MNPGELARVYAIQCRQCKRMLGVESATSRPKAVTCVMQLGWRRFKDGWRCAECALALVQMVAGGAR